MTEDHTRNSGMQIRGADASRSACIDLRSDTVTLPTAAMLARMQTARLGDDGLDGDPTTQELEALTARILGKEAGLFVPTATMGNLLAVLAQVQRQGQVALESSAHMFLTERGGATLAGVMYVGIEGNGRGEMDLCSLERALQPSSPLRTELVCLETTHVNAGGAALSLEHMRAVRELAQSHGARVHIDGARIFNAAEALRVAPNVIADAADTISVCLSKGLSAPAGAVLVGDSHTISQARKLRKMVGGAQRQIGVLAAAGLEAVEHMRLRLEEDHATARQLAEALRSIRPDVVGVTHPVSNIVFIELGANAPDSWAWADELRKHGVLIRPWGPRRIRLVTHRHIDTCSAERAITAFETSIAALLD